MVSILSGRENDALNAILGPIPKEKCQEIDSEARLVLAMLESLRAVLRRDMLCAHSVQYGVMDAVDWCRSRIRQIGNRVDLIQSIDAGLVKLEDLEVQFLYWTENQFAGGQLVDQTGRAVSEGEQYAVGVRWGLHYVKASCERLLRSEVQVKQSNFPVNSPLGLYGFFADAQKDFALNTLPKLQEAFKDRPTGYSSWLPSKSEFSYFFRQGLAEMLNVEPWHVTKEQCLALVEQLGEARFLALLNERQRWVARLGYGYEDLADPKDATSAIIACFEADQRQKDE